MRLFFAFLIFGAVFAIGDSAKILAVFSMAAYSHYSLGFRLAKELADRGHEVTFVNAYPQKKPIKNLKEISVAEILGDVDEMRKQLFNMGTMSYIGQLQFMNQMAKDYTTGVLSIKSIQDLLHSDEKFDVVIQEHFVNEALMIFAHKFNCPLILLAPGPTTVFNNHLFANPSPSSYVPNLLASGTPATFWERLVNAFFDILGELYVHNVMLPTQDALLKETVPGAPDLENIIYNASLMFLISHISFKDPAPLQPAIKEIGGYHVGPIKPLPADIKEFLDGAKHGAIIFSMGSNLKSADFPEDKKKAIINVFSRMKQRILWKFEVDLPGKPDNVKILKWLPQQDALAHPNVIAFISHVGLLGTIEAVYHGVPVLGLPVYWDQVKNIEDAVQKGFGLKIPFTELNEENFGLALNELVNNPKYRENAKLRSRIMHDQPMKQMDEAIYWIEYVIRYKGAPHLKSPGLHLKWYQRYLVDIILAIILVISFLLILVSCVCTRLLSAKKVKDKKE
uniref:UDP-glycosyltransferase n=1 Tax=Xylotrechus quadripes TaxID=554073 RepID=A0A6G7SEV8_9CUCU|nr:UDP-glycosyltransferase [Xylotrechus quadripes]